ncbi:MAG: methionyl-tRNA formyltransferase [Pseudomonadota bacterium]
MTTTRERVPSGLRLGFAGTPAFAATALRALIDAGEQVALAYTQPDRPTGRGRKLQPSPVKQLADTAGIEVRQPRSLRRGDAAAILAADELDLLIVAAYGLILPEPFLAAPRLGCVNVHASLLPRWRGAAPIERAIMAGDTESGVCIMQMDAGLDTGAVHRRAAVAIGPTTTGRELHDQLAELGGQELLAALIDFDPAAATPQPAEGITYADKLTPAESLIDWHGDADSIARQINALNDRQPARSALAGETVLLLAAHAIEASPDAAPAPGTITERGRKHIDIACGRGTLRLGQVQLTRGKGRPMPMAAALNGYGDLFAPGARFAATTA